MELPEWTLKGTTALVTGASSGLGRSMSRALALAGAEVALASRNKEGLEELKRDLDELDCLTQVVHIDVKDEDSVGAAVSWIRSKWGAPDLVVNNAGLGMSFMSTHYKEKGTPFFEVEPKKMDWWGLGIFSFGLTFVLLAISFLSYGMSGETLGLVFMVSGLILIAVFAKVETKTKFPMLDLSLFKSRLFAMGNIAQLVVATVWSSILVLLALFLEIGLGYPPLNAGLAIIPTEIALLIVSITSGKLSDKYGSRLLCPAGLAVMSFGLFAMGTFDSSTGLGTIIATSIVLSVGSGLFNSPNFRAIMSSVPANRRGIASGVRNTMFQMGLTASYGLTILFFTFGIPYNTLSQLLQGTVAQPSAALARSEFFDGFRITCILMAVIVAVTIIPSLMRGQKETLSPSIEPKFDV